MKINQSFVYKLLACFDILPLLWTLRPLLQGKPPLLWQQYQQLGKLARDFAPISPVLYAVFAGGIFLYISLPFSARLLWQQSPNAWKLALAQTPLRLIASTPSIPFLLTAISPLGVAAAYLIWLLVEAVKVYGLKRTSRNCVQRI